MDLFRWNVKRFAFPDALLDQRLALLDAQNDFARQHVDRLVFLVVILEGQHVAGLDMQDLADILVRLGPDDLVAPGLLDPIGYIAHASLNFREEGIVTHAVTQTPHPTQPSGLSTGRPL